VCKWRKKKPKAFIDTAAFSIHFRDLSFAHSEQGRKKGKTENERAIFKKRRRCHIGRVFVSVMVKQRMKV
jgi:hypothetical protein